MPIFRDAMATLMRLFTRSGQERGQSLTEYTLILVVVGVATIAVLGMVSSTVSGQLDPLTTALGGEGGGSALGILVALPSWIVVGVLVVGAAGLYALRMWRG